MPGRWNSPSLLCGGKIANSALNWDKAWGIRTTSTRKDDCNVQAHFPSMIQVFLVFFGTGLEYLKTTRNFLTFVKTTAIAYWQKMDQSLKILVAWNSGRFYKRQKITSNLLCRRRRVCCSWIDYGSGGFTWDHLVVCFLSPSLLLLRIRSSRSVYVAVGSGASFADTALWGGGVGAAGPRHLRNRAESSGISNGSLFTPTFGNGWTKYRFVGIKFYVKVPYRVWCPIALHTRSGIAPQQKTKESYVCFAHKQINTTLSSRNFVSEAYMIPYEPGAGIWCLPKPEIHDQSSPRQLVKFAAVRQIRHSSIVCKRPAWLHTPTLVYSSTVSYIVLLAAFGQNSGCLAYGIFRSAMQVEVRAFSVSPLLMWW